MSDAKFTPGPWEVMPGDKSPRVCVEGDKEWPIVLVVSGHNDEAIEANQHLISAAPEMFDALIELTQLMDNLMKKGNVNWGKTFGINFGLMNSALIKMDRSVKKARGLK